MKSRIVPESNYRSIWLPSGKTIRIAIDPSKPITELEYPEFFDISLNGSSCFGGCQFCLVDSTLITTIDGKKKISDINIGDTVINVNHKTFSIMTNVVDQIHKTKFVGDLIVITLENGNELKITPNHKVYSMQRGWITAGELKSDDELLDI